MLAHMPVNLQHDNVVTPPLDQSLPTGLKLSWLSEIVCINGLSVISRAMHLGYLADGATG